MVTSLFHKFGCLIKVIVQNIAKALGNAYFLIFKVIFYTIKFKNLKIWMKSLYYNLYPCLKCQCCSSEKEGSFNIDTVSLISCSTRELANVIFISANDRNICPQQRSVGTELEPALAGLSFSLSSCAVCLAGRGNDL